MGILRKPAWNGISGIELTFTFSNTSFCKTGSGVPDSSAFPLLMTALWQYAEGQ
jgi:hypothetical protein